MATTAPHPSTSAADIASLHEVIKSSGRGFDRLFGLRFRREPVRQDLYSIGRCFVCGGYCKARSREILRTVIKGYRGRYDEMVALVAGINPLYSTRVGGIQIGPNG